MSWNVHLWWDCAYKQSLITKKSRELETCPIIFRKGPKILKIEPGLKFSFLLFYAIFYYYFTMQFLWIIFVTLLSFPVCRKLNVKLREKSSPRNSTVLPLISDISRVLHIKTNSYKLIENSIRIGRKIAVNIPIIPGVTGTPPYPPIRMSLSGAILYCEATNLCTALSSSRNIFILMKGSLPFCVSMCQGFGLASKSETEPWDSPRTLSPNSRWLIEYWESCSLT